MEKATSYSCTDDQIKKLRALLRSYVETDTLRNHVSDYINTNLCGGRVGCGNRTPDNEWVKDKLEDENQCFRQEAMRQLWQCFRDDDFNDENYCHCLESACV